MHRKTFKLSPEMSRENHAASVFLKSIADTLTIARLSISVFFILSPLLRAKLSFKNFVLLVLIAWASDAIDGPLARLSGIPEGFIGKKDGVVDQILAISEVLWLTLRNFVPAIVGFLFVIFYPFLLLLNNESLLMLYVAIGHFLVILSSRRAFHTGFFVLVLWAIAVAILDRKRFFFLVRKFFEGIGIKLP